MKTFLLLACILSAFTVSFGDWQHPHYSFRCLEDGAVQLYGLHKDSNLTLVNNRGKECTYVVDSQAVTISPQCLNSTQGNSTVNIIVHDPCFDGPATGTPSGQGRKKRVATSKSSTSSATPTKSSKSSTPKSSTSSATSPISSKSSTPKSSTSSATSPISSTTTSLYIGGRSVHRFTITCKDIPDEGVNKTVAHVFQETDNHQLPENYKEVDGVEMRFKAVNDTAAPDISSIYVGDEFYMFLKYMGDMDYSLVPRKCEAIKGTMIPINHNVNSGNSVDLWKFDSSKKCTQHPELLAELDRVNSIVVAKMYGFRFSDNKYITITCDVTMYPAKLNKGVCIRRRKRSIELKIHQVSKTMQVFDSKNSYQSENRSQCNHGGISVWIVALITTTLYRQL